MKKIRFGIIGCGNMGGQHRPSFIRLKDEVELTCVCDIVIERAIATAKILRG